MRFILPRDSLMGGVLQPLRQLECNSSVVHILVEDQPLVVSLAKPFQQGRQSSLQFIGLCEVIERLGMLGSRNFRLTAVNSLRHLPSPSLVSPAWPRPVRRCPYTHLLMTLCLKFTSSSARSSLASNICTLLIPVLRGAPVLATGATE